MRLLPTSSGAWLLLLLASRAAAAPALNDAKAVPAVRQLEPTPTSLVIEPSPTGLGACTLHVDHWHCEGETEPAHDDEPGHDHDHEHEHEHEAEVVATPTLSATPTDTAIAASIEPSPTGQGACHLHGTHWHCSGSGAESDEHAHEEGEEGHAHEEGESHEGHSHGGHSHAGHSHGPSAEYGCGLAPLENYDLGLQIGAIFILLAVSLAGVLLPGVSGWLNDRIEKRTGDHHDGVHSHEAGGNKTSVRSVVASLVFVLQHFGGGVILATAFVHLLAHAFVYFSNECLGELSYEATSPAIAMAAIWLMFALDFFALRPLRQRVLETTGVVPTAFCCNPAQAGLIGGKSDTKDASSSEGTPSDLDARSMEEAALHAQGRLAKFEVLALEAGIIFHSIIIGVSIGTSSGPGWKAFLIAIAFHQFCEGLALASRIALLPTTGLLAKVLMYGAFVLTTPVGVAIGIGVRRHFNGNDRDTLLAIGTLNSISAGILIYAALVQIVAGDFIYNRTMLLAPLRRPLTAFIFFTLGAIAMSVLGKWA
ncbi:high-affinity Zn(2+) transporter zrt1 [Tilletia horrida]|uniref:High-affinity Zn(2+) transporter zrt1 n=1 Tax=Tilletia horrida TaxID=155126 RepID=A0AAN6JJ17_9BASI|nr:high-affinity Zn(2+) transporter zrt1 [Tilletia horrida]